MIIDIILPSVNSIRVISMLLLCYDYVKVLINKEDLHNATPETQSPGIAS